MKRRTVKAFMVGMAAVAVFPHFVKAAESLDFYRNLTAEEGLVQVVETCDLDYDNLTSRNGSFIIEEVYGVVLDSEGNGEIMNASDPDYNYINYSDVAGAKTGDVILTVLIYNPETNYEDDILYRYDYIIDSVAE